MRSLFFCLPLFLLACTPDSDGDGLSNKDEEAAGTNPEKRDTDGDGLGDAMEADFGTDPLVEDTDGDGLLDGDEKDMGTNGTVVDTDSDGYTDYAESLAGTNPADPASVIYTGGWPFNPDKDSMTVGDPDERRVIAGTSYVPRFQLVDQFGETVDIYDFGHQGKPILIDLSGAWCYWCNEMAKLIERQPSTFDDFAGDPNYPWIESLPDLVENGDLYWVTILDANNSSYESPPTERTISTWSTTYPNPYIPVMGDYDWTVRGWIDPDGWPTVMLVDENMLVHTFDKADYSVAIAAAMEMVQP